MGLGDPSKGARRGVVASNGPFEGCRERGWCLMATPRRVQGALREVERWVHARPSSPLEVPLKLKLRAHVLGHSVDRCGIDGGIAAWCRRGTTDKSTDQRGQPPTQRNHGGEHTFRPTTTMRPSAPRAEPAAPTSRLACTPPVRTRSLSFALYWLSVLRMSTHPRVHINARPFSIVGFSRMKSLANSGSILQPTIPTTSDA